VIFLSETTEDATTASMGDTSSATELGGSTGSKWMPLLANRVITITGGLEGISGRKNKYCGYDGGDGKFKCKYSAAVSEITRFEIFPYCPHGAKTETEALYEGPRCVPHKHASMWPGTAKNPSMPPESMKPDDATSYAIRSQKSGKWCGLHAPNNGNWYSTTRDKYELKCISDEVPTTGRFAFSDDGRLVIRSNEKAWEDGSPVDTAICIDEGNHGVMCTKSQGWYDSASRDKWAARFGIAKLYCGWPVGKVGQTAPTMGTLYPRRRSAANCGGIPPSQRPQGDQFVSELTESRRRTRL
jgi:hypothetical protein